MQVVSRDLILHRQDFAYFPVRHAQIKTQVHDLSLSRRKRIEGGGQFFSQGFILFLLYQEIFRTDLKGFSGIEDLFKAFGLANGPYHFIADGLQ